MHKVSGPEVMVMATKAMAIKAIVMAMVGVMGKPWVGPMPWVVEVSYVYPSRVSTRAIWS